MGKRDASAFGETKSCLEIKPCPTEEYEPRHSFLTKRWIVRPNYGKKEKSEIEQKEDGVSIPADIVHAYLVASQALSCKGFSEVTFDKNDPWNVTCTATGDDEKRYQIQMKINKDKNGVYYFNFKRTFGDTSKFHKFWKNCEDYLIHSKYFTDELVEEIDEQETLAAKQNLDDEKQERGADEGIKTD